MEQLDFICLIDWSRIQFKDFYTKHKQLLINHMNYLKSLKTSKKLLFAGNSIDKFYEFFIIRCNNEEEAKQLVNSDPLVESKKIPAEVCPFRTSLISEKKIDEALDTKDFDAYSIYIHPTTRYFLGTLTPYNPSFITDITEDERITMNEHFEYLKTLFDAGNLLLSGPILSEGKFGILVFESDDFNTCVQFLQNDPSVQMGIMTPNLHPFRILLKS